MRNKLEQRHEFNKILRELRENHDIIPFITLKYLSDKQEKLEGNLQEFFVEYGFTFRDYELLSNIIKKQENNDESYLSDLKSSINALKNANNSYIKEIYSQIPNKTLEEDILKKILILLKYHYDARRIYMEINRRIIPPFREIIEGRLPHLYGKMFSELINDNHEIINVYDPSCRDAEIIVKLNNFQTATLYEKDETKYLHAIQNFIIHDIPLDKLNISNEEIIVDETDTEYDTIISTPYMSKDYMKYFESSEQNIEKYNKYQSKNPNSIHLLNLIEHLSEDGILITLISLDLLVKKDAYKLRKCLIDSNILDSIIEYDKSIRNNMNIILIIKKNKKTDDILFIKENENSSRSFIHPRKILECYKERRKIKKFSDIISNQEIIENEYNLNPRRYVYTLEYIPKDLDEIKRKQKAYKSKLRELDEEIEELLYKIQK